MRVRTKWSDKNRERTPEEIAGVVAFICWRIASQAVLDLENNDYQTDTQVQRLAILWEFAAFLCHVTDRMMFPRMTQEERQVFISVLGRKLVQTMDENMEDTLGPGDYKPELLATLNQRMGEYSRFNYDDRDGPSFPMLRYFGECVTLVVGERNRKWVATHVMDVEGPDAVRVLKRSLSSLLPEEESTV